MANKDRQPAAQRREAARERARQLKLEQERRARRNKILAIVAIVAGVALVVGVIGYIVYQGTKSPMDEYDGPIPENVESDGSINVGSDGAAGSTTDGAKRVEVYADFTCHYCADFEEANGADLNELTLDGTVQYNMRPIAFLDSSGDFSGYASRAIEGLYLVADGAPELVLQANSALFSLWTDNLEEIQSTGQQPTDQQIIDTLVGIGVPEDVAGRLDDHEYQELVDAVTNQAASDGISGTPTIFIDDEEWVEDRYTPGALWERITGEARTETSTDGAESPSEESASQGAETSSEG
jgi:protein-disulfide isomerase